MTASNSFSFNNSINLQPQSADPSNPTTGQLQIADGTVRTAGLWNYNGAEWILVGSVDTTDAADILTKKAIESASGDFTIKGNSYLVDPSKSAFPTTSQTFVDANVTTGTDTITVTGHGFHLGLPVQLTTSGTLPAGLALATTYYVISMTVDTFKLASSYANALVPTPVDITAAAGGGTHTIVIQNNSTFSILASGSDALLTNDNANAVFALDVATGAIVRKGDFVGFSQSIPAAFRNNNLGITFNYRTYIASGSTSDNDWRFYAFDHTNRLITTNNDTTGAFTAGTSMVVTSSASFAVGDRVLVQQSNGSDWKDTHVTAIADGTHLTFADAVSITKNDLIIRGCLTDVTSSAIKAYDSNTNKDGSVYKTFIQIPATCTSIDLVWQNNNSNTNSKFFFDNILVSADPYKKFNTFQQSDWAAYTPTLSAGWGTTTAVSFLWKKTGDTCFVKGTFICGTVAGSLGTITLPNSFSIDSAKVQLVNTSGNPGPIIGWAVKGTANDHAGIVTAVTTSTTLVYLAGNLGGTTRLTPTNVSTVFPSSTQTSVEFSFPILNSPSVLSIITESVDSVGAAPTTFTPTGSWVSNTVYTGTWRRVFDFMELDIKVATGGAPTSASLTINIPSGYIIDTSKLIDITQSVAEIDGTVSIRDVSADNFIGLVRYDTTTSIGIFKDDGDGTVSAVTQAAPMTFASGDFIVIKCRVPIAGWSATNKPLLAFPTTTVGGNSEEYFADTRTGVGATNTKVPYYTNVNRNTIANLGTISNGSTNGWSFTATTRCKYHISAWDNFSTAQSMGIDYYPSGASTQYTTAIQTITAANRIGIDVTSAANLETFVTARGVMNPGDVIGPHFGTTTTAGTGTAGIRLTVEPEIGQSNQAAIISSPSIKVSSTATTNLTTSGGWSSDITLNTMSGDIAACGASLASNQITLPAGQYELDFTAPFFNITAGQPIKLALKIKNVTDANDVSGFFAYAEVDAGSLANDKDSSRIHGIYIFWLGKTTAISIQGTVAGGSGGVTLGGSGTIALSGYSEEYYQLIIRKKK